MTSARPQQDMIRFLKRYSTVENAFIDDFFSLVDPASTQTHSVDLEKVSKWLKVPKYNLMKTLKASYMDGVDYTVSKPTVKLAGRGRNTRRDVMLTPDCFKTLCMQSHSQQADRVRAYFIAVEQTLMRYRADIVEVMESRIRQLELNQRPLNSSLQKTGLIYVISSGASRYKVGRTSDLAARLRSHGSASADALHKLYEYKTNDVVAVEGCVKQVLKKYQYRKYKEVYEADIVAIKEAIDACGDTVKRVQMVASRKSKQGLVGGETAQNTFLVMIKGD